MLPLLPISCQGGERMVARLHEAHAAEATYEGAWRLILVPPSVREERGGWRRWEGGQEVVRPSPRCNELEDICVVFRRRGCARGSLARIVKSPLQK